MSRRRATRMFYGPKRLYSSDGVGKGGDYRHPGVMTVPQSPSFVLDANNPLNKSSSHRTVVLPRLQYVDTHQDQRTYNTAFGNGQADSRSVNLHNSTPTAAERVLPSDALINLYRLAEKVYHVDTRQNGHHIPTSSPPAPSKGRDGVEIGHALGSSHAYDDYSRHTHHSTNRNFSSASSTVSDLSDSRASLYTLGASTLVGDNDLASSSYGASGYGWQKGQIDEIKAMLQNIASSVAHSPIKGNEDPYQSSILRLEKANSTLEKTNSELVKTNSKLQHDIEQSHVKLEQANAKWQKEHHSHEQADAQIKVLQAELKHASTRLHFVEGLLDEGKRREEALQHRYDALSASIQDLRALLSSQTQSHSQMHLEQQQHEPAWVKGFRQGIRVELTGFGTGLKGAIADSHQCTISSKEELLDAIGSEKASIVGPVTTVKTEVESVRSQLDSTTRIVRGVESRINDVDQLSSKVDSGISRIETAVKDSERVVNSTVAGLAAKLDSHAAHSTEILVDLQTMVNERTNTSLKQNSQTTASISETNVLVQALNDRVQQFINGSTEREQIYANISASSKKASEDDDKDAAEHSPATAIAIESLRTAFATSFTGIRDAVDKQHVDIRKILSQTETHGDRQDLVASQADNTLKRLENLDTSIRQATSDNASSSAHTLARLEKLEEELGRRLEAVDHTVSSRLGEVSSSLENVSNGAWVVGAIDECNLTKKEDIADAIDEVSLRLDRLESSQSKTVAGSLADVSTQLDSISSRLVGIETGIQGAATSAEIVEEISTIKASHSNEHQANIAAATRVQSAVESLEDYTKNALDQVNVALDEQQSRLVAIQSHCRQQSEDSKSLSATLAVNTDMLRQANSPAQPSPAIESFASTQNQVVASLEDVKATLAAIKESDSSRLEALRSVSSRSDESFNGIRFALKEQQSLLQSLSERFTSEPSEREEIISSKIAEIVTLLTSVISTVEITSKETTVLREMIVNVDAQLSTNNTTDADNLRVSSSTLVNISQAIDSLSQNLATFRGEINSTLTSQSTLDYTPLETMISELRAKVDNLLVEVNGTRTSLCEDISALRQESSNKTELLDAHIINIKGVLDGSTNKSDEQISSLRTLLESRAEEYAELRNTLSQSHSSSTATITAQLQDINVALQSLALTEVQASLDQLSVSISAVQGLVAEENSSGKISSSTLAEIQAVLQSLSEKLALITQSQNSNESRHEAVVALLDRNHEKCNELHDTLVSQHTKSKETVSTIHASSLAALEEVVASFKAYFSSNEEKYQSIQKTLSSLQTVVDQRSQTESTQVTEVTSKVTEVSQTLVELRQLLQSQSTSSESIQSTMSKWESSHSSLTAIIEKQYAETIEVLTRSIESLRTDVNKEPAQLNAMLVAIQEQVTSLQQSITVTQQSWQQSLQSQIAVLHQEMTNNSSRDLSLGEDIKQHQHQTEILREHLQRMEKLQIVLEALVSHHHCEGCNCKGYDSDQASPLYRKRGLSRVGSEATGTSPQPYVEQSFDVPSPSPLRKEFSVTETQAKPYSVEFLGSYEDHSGQGDASEKDKPEKISFPPAQGNRRGSVGSGSGSGSGRHITIHHTSSSEHHHHHHHKHHDEREISNPFELFARRPRKSSHKPDGPEESHGAESSDRVRVKSNNAPPVRTSTSTSIGSGKGQRVSLLGSALLSAVSDTAVPQARERIKSGNMSRLSSLFGKHHHHHEGSVDETSTKHDSSGKPKDPARPSEEEEKKSHE
ncbi:hypothetical protein FRC17_009156 [Serendipita sp. 399]|nr:hypothetical protein FRC17_009156 [Serendipita sp. 399]